MSDTPWQRLVSNLVKDAEFEQRAHRIFYPGSYEPSLHSMMLNPDQEEEKLTLVFIHEDAHFRMGQRHWGEAIRRLDHLGVQVSMPLDMRRVQELHRLLTNNSNRKPTDEELLQIAYSAKLRNKIRNVLLRDRHFMKGLRLIDQCEKKKSILSSQWNAIQEGFAYWSCFTLGRETFESTGCQEGLLRVESEASKVASLPPDHLKAYRAISDISDALDSDFGSVLAVVYICLNPSFETIPILQDSVDDLEQRVAEPHHSPDKRLFEAYRIILSERFDPRTSPPEDLYRRLDGTSKEPFMTNDSFNEYWDRNVDMAPTVVEIMNSLYRDLGTEVEYKFEPLPKHDEARASKVRPIVVFSDSAAEYQSQLTDDVDHDQKEGLPKTDVILKQYQRLALKRDGLMHMARRERLIHA